MKRGQTVLLTGGLVALVLAVPALGSNKIASSAADVHLGVLDADTAVIAYRANGERWAVTATRAINARFPSPSFPQAKFHRTYSKGGHAAGECRPYDGPPLPWLVAACKGVNGDYWAAQAWPRNLPNYGVTPWRAVDAEWDLRLSHWRGPLPVLTVKVDWAYRQYDHLYGSLTYLGRPMYGFGTTPAGNPTDRHGVLVYLDTLNPVYGPGWQRENSFVTHRGSGVFCYGFYPHGTVPSGRGEAYRTTVVGPGVFPDLMWQGSAPGAFDPFADAIANAEQRTTYADRLCRPN
jgi:hypothetical protein